MMSMPNPTCSKCGASMTMVDGTDRIFWECAGRGEDFHYDQMDHEDAQAAYITTLEAEITALKAEKHRIPDRWCPMCHAETGYYDGYICTECDWYQLDSDVNPLTADQCIAVLRQTTIAHENAALRQQVAALQAAQAPTGFNFPQIVAKYLPSMTLEKAIHITPTSTDITDDDSEVK